MALLAPGRGYLVPKSYPLLKEVSRSRLPPRSKKEPF